MANPTFKLISSSTVGAGGASTIDFTSIPGTYTDLCVKFSAKSDNGNSYGDYFVIKFNSNTSSYTTMIVGGNGSSAFSLSLTSRWAAQINSTFQTSNTFGNGEIYIPNYAGSANKTFSSDSSAENNATNSESELAAGLWSNTAAITSISFASGNGGTIQQHSTVYLYGITKS